MQACSKERHGTYSLLFSNGSAIAVFSPLPDGIVTHSIPFPRRTSASISPSIARISVKKQ